MHKRDSGNMFMLTGFMKMKTGESYVSGSLSKPAECQFLNIDLTLNSTDLQGNGRCRYINYLNG